MTELTPTPETVEAAPSPEAALNRPFPSAPTSTLSVLALVFGIIGLVFSFFFLGLLPAIAGVILGHLAVKREPHARSMATAGFITGYAGIAVSIVWALVVIVPFLLVLLAASGLSAAAIGINA
jgi:hypothetical protein